MKNKRKSSKFSSGTSIVGDIVGDSFRISGLSILELTRWVLRVKIMAVDKFP